MHSTFERVQNYIQNISRYHEISFFLSDRPFMNMIHHVLLVNFKNSLLFFLILDK